MEKRRTFIVKKSLVSWILMGNYKLKLFLLLAVIVTVLIRIIPLEMQKRIVNQAISLKAFDLLLIYCEFTWRRSFVPAPSNTRSATCRRLSASGL